MSKPKTTKKKATAKVRKPAAKATAAAYEHVIEDFGVSTGSTTVGDKHADR